MDDDKFRALARQHAHLALKFLATTAVDPKASPREQEHARRELEHKLKQIGEDISPDLRRELENAVHGK
jgi:hypothetical protein